MIQKEKESPWIGLDDKLHRTIRINEPAKPVKVRHRTITETDNGALAIFRRHIVIFIRSMRLITLDLLGEVMTL